MLAYTFYESDFRVMRYAEALKNDGNEVVVVALKKPGAAKHAIINGVNLIRIQSRIVNEKGRFTYFFRILKFFISSTLYITKSHLKCRYDLIHVHNVPDFLVFSAIIPKLSGTKIILDIHDILPEFYASKFSGGKKNILFKCIGVVEWLSVRFCDHVIVSNHIWRQKLIKRSAMAENCTAIINYPNNELFYPRKKLNSGKKFVMLYPGTINWHQGLDIAVRAVDILRYELPELFFHIYGSGAARDELVSLIEELGLKERVILYRGKPLHKIAEVVAGADLGVIPKRNDQFGGEAFSTKTLEFMASGVPIIVSRTKVDQYYFDDSLVKFFMPGDAVDLAAAIKAMVHDKELRNRISRNGYEFAQKNKWSDKKKDYLDLVDRLCCAKEQ